MNESAKSIGGTVLAGLLILAVWWFATGPGGVQKTVLPSPVDLLDALKRGFVDGLLYPHIRFTLSASAMGLVIGGGLGMIVGAAVALIRPLGPFVTPLVIGLQSVPKVAIAPLFVAYLGFGMGSKVFTSALLCFFPLFVASVTGLRAVDPRFVDLFRGFSASKLHVLLNVRIPAAAPYLFAAIKIAIALSLIGCVVSEFVASSQGLGYVIKARSSELDVAMMFAALLSLSAIGVIGTGIVRLAQIRLVFWQKT
jgi:NitT/TauT family transport system permease protein